jgi:hypothetical protein
MTIRKLAIAAAMSLTSLGWSAAGASERNEPHAVQRQDGSAHTARGGGQYSREGARHSPDQQGRGYNGGDSYRQRGQDSGRGSRSGGHGYDAPYQRARGDHHGHVSAHARSHGGSGHSSRCTVRWRHHRRIRVCP